MTPPGFVGGRPEPPTYRPPTEAPPREISLGSWSHGHPQSPYRATIRYVHRPDDRCWAVDWSGVPSGTWVFLRQEDAEVAVVELQATLEGEWEHQPGRTTLAAGARRQHRGQWPDGDGPGCGVGTGGAHPSAR